MQPDLAEVVGSCAAGRGLRGGGPSDCPVGQGRDSIGPLDEVRIDRWLCAARLYKSRTLAQQACEGGHVRVNDQVVKSSHVVRVGDRVAAATPAGKRKLRVKALEEKRQSPARATELFEDTEPIERDSSPRIAVRPRGMGRPTKADRRALARLRWDAEADDD